MLVSTLCSWRCRFREKARFNNTSDDSIGFTITSVSSKSMITSILTSECSRGCSTGD